MANSFEDSEYWGLETYTREEVQKADRDDFVVTTARPLVATLWVYEVNHYKARRNTEGKVEFEFYAPEGCRARELYNKYVAREEILVPVLQYTRMLNQFNEMVHELL